MTVEELCVVVSVTAEEALQGLEMVTGRLQAMGRQAEEMKPLEIRVNSAAMDEASRAIQGLASSLQSIGTQADEMGSKLEKMGKTAASDETKKALSLDWDATTAQKTGAIAEIAVKNFGEAVKDTTKDVVEDLQKQEKGAFALKDVIQGLGGSLKSILTKGFVGAGIDLLIEGAGSLITHLVNAGAEQEKIRRAQAQADKEAVAAQKESNETLDELAEKYRILSDKKALTYSEEREMADIQAQLENRFGITATAVDGLTGAYDGLAIAIQIAQHAQRTALAEKSKEAAKNAEQAYVDELTQVYMDRDVAVNAKNVTKPTRPNDWGEHNKDVAQCQTAIDGYNKTLAESTSLQSAFSARLTEVTSKAKESGKAVNDDLLTAIEALVKIDASSVSGVDGGLKFVDQIADFVGKAVTDPKIGAAVNRLSEIGKQVMNGITPSADDIAAFTAGWQLLSDDGSPLMAALNMKAKLTDEVTDSGETLLPSLVGFGDGFRMIGENGKEFTGSLEDVRYNLVGMAEEMSQAGDAANTYSDTIKQLEEDTKELEKRVNNTAAIKKYVKQWDDGYKALRNAKKGSKEAGNALEDMAEAAKGANVAFDGTEEGAEGVNKEFQMLGKDVDVQSASIAAALAMLEGQLVNAEAEMFLQGAAGLDISAAAAKIAELKQLIAAIVAYANANSISLSNVGGGDGDAAPRKGGGGGGRGKKDDAEEAARAAEEARKEAIRRDYDTLAHKRHMNEITLEEELAMLEKIRKKRRLNAEEIMDWEEKIYDLKKEIRERDADSVDNMGDSVMDALTARYEAMREAEIGRLDESRKGWEKWRDDSVKAIEDQIAALDKLADTEDREKKDAEELRKIAKLKQEIEFEQDDYNRAKLSQQLEAALAARADRLHKLELQDQKDALREQIEQIEQKADSEIDALDKEQEELEKVYEERLKDAAIRAEAEKLILTQSQDQLLELLKEYAPDYDATGQTLGEKLLEGFQKKVGGIAEWFKAFNAQMAQAQEQMAAMAQEAAGAFYQQESGREKATGAPTVVNQTVQFYEPVETPSQVARRITQVNEELAVLLLG